MKTLNLIKMLVMLTSVAGVFAVPAVASAHYGDATANCVESTGVITANFHAFYDDLVNKNVIVSVDGKQIESFTPPKTDFVKTYKPYAIGNHTVVANWAIDSNKNGKVDAGEAKSFTSVVTVPETCKPKEVPTPKCAVVGKETLLANDVNCKDTPKETPKETPKDTPKVLPAVTEIPNTGAGTGAMVSIFAAVTIAGALIHNKVLNRR